MASTVLARRLSDEYRVNQSRLSAQTVARMLLLWRLIDPQRLEETVPEWQTAVLALLPRQAETSEALARRYFREFSVAETGRIFDGTIPPVGFDDESVRARLTWAGPGQIGNQLRTGKPIDEAAQAAGVFAARYAQQIVADVGRRTVQSGIRTDRRALGYQRVTDGDPCAFCALLASRGPVYKRSTGGFQAHPSCGCTAEPVYSETTALPPGAAEWRDLYSEAAQGQPEPLKAFRRAYENR